jgi:ribonucleoside-diphosphate reductase alpha chain
MPDEVREKVARQGIRNVTLLTQAPTGTVGTMVGTSTGIEPFYAFKYVRQSRLGLDEQYVPIAQEWLDAHPGESLPGYFVGAMDLSPEEHVHIQAAVQRWTDSSISKTANAPESYTAEETKKLYELAYDLGCKGVTIYRDRSRHEQVLHVEKSVAPPAAGPEVHPVPAVIAGHTYRVDTPAGTTRVVINESDGEPFEVFLLLARAGSEVQSFMEALGRIMSVFLRTDSRIPARRRLQLLAEQLQGIGGANQMGLGPRRVLSVVDALGQVLARHLNGDSPSEDGAPVLQPPAPRGGVMADLCPSCGSPSLIHEEGCAHCTSCGYSRC